MGAYLDTVLPVYGRDFADWWRDRLRPEMERNFAFLEARLDAADGMDLAEVACLLEDAIDIHDRHWKIHWMLNFAQLSATLNLRAVMEKTRGTRRRGAPRPAPELGLRPELGLDRGALADEERGPRRRRAAGGVRGRRRRRDRRGPQRPATAAGGSSPSGSSRTSASSAGTPSGATSSSSRPSASRWSRSSSSSAATSTTDYDYPSAIEAMRLDIEAASREILDGLTGDALEEMRAANAVNLRMAPLTPDHHFYIDQGANAHVRLVLIAVGRKLVEAGRLDQPDDVMFLRYNELRALIGSADAIDAREIVAARRARARGRGQRPPARLGRHRDARRSSPSRTSSTGATRIGSTRSSPTDVRLITRHRRRRPASSRASPASSGPSTSSTRSATATSSSAR